VAHDDQQDAMKELDHAADGNPQDTDALMLMGRISLQAFNFDAADAAVEGIRAVNPDSIAANILLTRSLLQQRRPGDAQATIKHVLTTQPANIEALGLLAATEALQLHDEQTAAILKQVDKLDPHNASAYLDVADQLGAMRQYPRAAAMYQVAVNRAPWWTSARNGLGLLYTQSGDEDKALAVLNAAHELDPFNYSTTNYLRLLDELMKFARKETPHFVVFYDPQTDPVIPEYFGDYLESIYKAVCSEYHQEPPVKTFIEVFPTHDAFSVRTTGSPWIGTVGASTGRVIAMVAPRKGHATMGPFNWSQVLRHEFTHTVTLAATDNRIAHWFTEGLAVSQEHAPLRWEWVPMLYQAVNRNQLFPLNQITWGFIRPKRPIDRQLAYAESFWICQYIEGKWGHESILKMLAEFRLGKEQPEVFQTVLGQSESEFEKGFFAWCHDQVATWGYDEDSTKRYDELRKEGEDLIHAREYDKAVDAWKQIEKLRPVDQLPHTRLAGLYLHLRQWPAAIEELKQLHLRSLHDNTYAKRIARIYRDIGQQDQAINYAMQSVYIDPYDSDAHELLADLDDKAGNTAGAKKERHVLEILANMSSDDTKPTH
jgi:tetratricopeptide (TPR) repeat protein